MTEVLILNGIIGVGGGYSEPQPPSYGPAQWLSSRIFSCCWMCFRGLIVWNKSRARLCENVGLFCEVVRKPILVQTSLCWASYISWHHGTARICCCAPWLLLSASRAAINRYLLPAGLRAANPQQQRATTAWRDGRTGRQKTDSFMDPALHTRRTVPIIITCRPLSITYMHFAQPV